MIPMSTELLSLHKVKFIGSDIEDLGHSDSEDDEDGYNDTLPPTARHRPGCKVATRKKLQVNVERLWNV